MVRTVITPNKQDISIHIPESFIGKQVEVIAFTIDAPTKESYINDKPMTHFASEKTLAKEWLTPEEDTAWQDL